MKNNKYDYFLITLICLLIFGMYGDSLQPIRVVALSSIPFIIISFLETRDVKNINNVYKTSGLLFLWIVFTILWTSDIVQGAKEIFYYLSHFSLLILTILCYNKANNPLKSLTKGWIILISLSLVVAYFEIFYNQHLSVSLIESDFKIYVDGKGIYKKFASVTFGNYNTYVMVIAMALPFLFGFLFLHKRFQTQLFTILVITSSYFVLFINASRGGLIAGGIILLTWIIFAQRKKVNHPKIKMLILIPLAIYAIFNHINVILDQVSNRVSNGSSFIQDEGRMELFLSAFNAFWEKPFFGSGIGSIQEEMENVLITLPHNLFLEFLVQFGLIATVVLCIILLNLFKNIPNLKSTPKAMLISIFLTFPLIIIINSTYLLHPIVWIFIASIYCIGSLNKSNISYD
ncbi:O-antigen ligase family protein [Brumimicrobium mesophilum]|uniref:O-antigen ligase family protein n=1 Tax=Brumimicrobium mesophilum TaxID=392717 RepID=UPI00131B41A0|nr:O-antigen ligase family protein [Brumimicrobium mesophilum]